MLLPDREAPWAESPGALARRLRSLSPHTISEGATMTLHSFLDVGGKP